MPPKIFLYAEILTHLRQLTLYASLETEKKEGTRIDVSSDKKLVTVVHDGESQSIYLPTQISGTAEVTFPMKRTTDLSARLQIDDMEEWKDHNAAGVEAPWSASELSSQTSLWCRHCNARILSPAVIQSWKDLPSDSWAELMDIWFCHKPHSDDDKAEQAAKAKGFSSASKLNAAAGIGYTDLVSFVLHVEDCENVKAAEVLDKQNTVAVRCNKCVAILGSANNAEDLLRLEKSEIAVKQNIGGDAVHYPFTTFVSARLLSMIESTSIRKFVVHSKADSCDDSSAQITSGLLLWIFNPDIYYSSSAHSLSIGRADRPTSFVHRASKIFYQLLPDPLQHLEDNHNTVEELLLRSQELVNELREYLESSTKMLPQSARAFQDWTIGLLDRYEKNPTGQVVMDQNPLTRKSDGPVTRWELPAGYEALYE